ncbi:hypothetical protein FRB93_000242 [Tulasnella sp. JGI-2019a]|nr:hypothetical protein FRB93_000242 [Tulasnella sp. JGI-2019a]
MTSYSSPATLPSCLLEPFPPPLEAPVAFEGADISLATEVLPPPPPLFTSNGKRPADYLRKRAIPSYLPSTDPASTYNSGTGVKGVEYTATEDEGSDRGGKRKRQRTEKAEATLPKQTTSRHHSPRVIAPLEITTDVVKTEDANSADVDCMSSTSVPPELTVDAPLPAIPSHINNMRARRSSSLLAASRLSQLDWSLSGNGNGKRKDSDPASPILSVDGQMAAVSRDDSQSSKEGLKGKGKGKADEQRNSTDCTTCSMSLLYSSTAAVCCDGCPRSFHLCCLDPPMDDKDISNGQWFCVRCMAARSSLPEHSITTPRAAGPFAELINKTATDFPSVFLLPEDIRTYFRDIGTTTDGTYIDTGDLRGTKNSRTGMLEDRDPYRLKDRQGAATLCFKCGTSAAPYGAEEETLGQVAKCAGPSPPAVIPTAIRPQMDGLTKYHSDRGASPERSKSVDGSTPSEGSGEGETVLMHPGPWRRTSVQVKVEPLPSQLDLPRPAPMLRRSSRRSAAASDTTPTSVGAITDESSTIAKTVDGSESCELVGPGFKLPVGVTTTGLKAMIPCDYCPLSWHLDCLDPPMVTLPPNHKKWMCPNHAEHVIPKRRTPRQIKTVTVSSTVPTSTLRKTFGNIEVIPLVAPRQSLSSTVAQRPDALPVAPRAERVPSESHFKKRKRTSLDSASHGIEDFTMNGVKYRLPEKMIRLNFWNFREQNEISSSTATPTPKDRATIIRERARRTLSSTSSLSSLSEPSDADSDSESEKKNRPTTTSNKVPLSDQTVQLAAETLVSMCGPVTANFTATAQTVMGSSHRRPITSQPLEELVSVAMQTRALPPASPTKAISTPSKKPASSSYKIRIPALAARHAPGITTATHPPNNNSSKPILVLSAHRQQKLSSEASTSSASTTIGPELLSGSTSEPEDTLRRQANGVFSQGTQASPTKPGPVAVTSEELEQLRAIRELMSVKGKQALLDWLKS